MYRKVKAENGGRMDVWLGRKKARKKMVELAGLTNNYEYVSEAEIFF